MNCNFHKDIKATTKCNFCKSDLCEECGKFQEKFGACPKCSKSLVKRLHSNLKRGLFQNFLSITFAVAFVVLYVVYVCRGSSTLFVVLGAVGIAIIVPLSIFLLFYNSKNIKKLQSYLDLENDNKKTGEHDENIFD